MSRKNCELALLAITLILIANLFFGNVSLAITLLDSVMAMDYSLFKNKIGPMTCLTVLVGMLGFFASPVLAIATLYLFIKSRLDIKENQPKVWILLVFDLVIVLCFYIYLGLVVSF